jgi:hypothetical protein
MYRGRVEKARWLAWGREKSTWHYYGAQIGSIKSFSVVWPGVGPLKLAIVTATRHQPPADQVYLISNDPTRSHLAFFAFCPHRWTVEVFFRAAKQLVGWGQSPARSPHTVVGHLVLSAVAYTLLELLAPADACGAHGNTRSDRFHIARREDGATVEAVKTWLQRLQWVHVVGTPLPGGTGACAVVVEQPTMLYAPSARIASQASPGNRWTSDHWSLTSSSGQGFGSCAIPKSAWLPRLAKNA